MILKYLDAGDNWNFLEGSIAYRYVSMYDVVKHYLKGLETNHVSYEDLKTKNEVFEELERVVKQTKEISEIPTVFNMMKNYIKDYFWKAKDGREIVIDNTNLSSQQPELLSGIYIVEVDNGGKAGVDYVLLDRKKAFILSDKGQTVETLIK